MGQNPDITIFDNDIPDITMSFQRTERKIFPDITILQYQYTDTVAHASSQGDESDSDDDISVIEPTSLGLTPVQATEVISYSLLGISLYRGSTVHEKFLQFDWLRAVVFQLTYM